MRGLIVKDLYVLKNYMKQFVFIYLFIACAFSAAGAESGSITSVMSFMMIYSVVFGSTVLLSSMSMDEAVSFYRFALTTPLGIKKLVKSKFVLLLLTIFTGAAVGLLTCGVLYLLPLSWNGPIDWTGIIAVMSLFILCDSVMVAVAFKKGAEKARYIYIIVMFALAVVIFGIGKICEGNGIFLEILNRLPAVFFAVTAVFASALSIIISYFVTLRVVRKKEW